MNRSSNIAAVTLLAAILVCSRSDGGLDMSTGREWHLWMQARYSLIIARVKAITQARPGENGTHRAILEPICTLAGSLDPSEHPTLDVTLYADGMTSSVGTPPKQGSLILAVTQGTNFIVSDICTFMPNRASVQEINGMGDPRVLETLKKLQDARAHAEPDPHIRISATTNKSGTTRPK